MGKRELTSEEHMDQSETIEGTKDHVHLPVDLPKKRRNRKSQSTVPSPIARSGQAHSLSTDLSREDFRRISPAGRAPSRSEGSNEEVRASDDSLGCRGMALDDPGDCVVIFIRVGTPVRGLDGACNEEPGHHEEAADEHGGTTTEAIEVQNGREGKSDIDDVLDRGGEQLVSDAGTLHDVDLMQLLEINSSWKMFTDKTYNIVHHDVHSTKLRPHLNAHTENHTLEHAGSNKSLEACNRLFTLEPNRFLDFAILGKDLGIVQVAVSVKESEGLVGFIPAVFASEPTRRLGEEEHADKEDECRNHLDTPWNTEGGRALVGVLCSAIDERGTVLDEVLDQDSPMRVLALVSLCSMQGILREALRKRRPRLSNHGLGKSSKLCPIS